MSYDCSLWQQIQLVYRRHGARGPDCPHCDLRDLREAAMDSVPTEELSVGSVCELTLRTELKIRGHASGWSSGSNRIAVLACVVLILSSMHCCRGWTEFPSHLWTSVVYSSAGCLCDFQSTTRRYLLIEWAKGHEQQPYSYLRLRNNFSSQMRLSSNSSLSLITSTFPLMARKLCFPSDFQTDEPC